MVQIAMTAGGKLAVQPNQNGTLGIQLVERIAPPEQNVFPCIGIQFDHFDEKPFGNRCHIVQAHFDIVVAVQRQYDPNVTDTGYQTLVDLSNYVNDGNGNGLSPVLRADPTLLGNCGYGYIASMTRALLRGQGEAAGAVASAIYHYVAEDQVKF